MDIVNEKSKNKIQPYIKSIANGTLRGPVSLHILITDFCVNKCNMCLHWATEKKKIMGMDTLAKIWDEMNENQGESICMTGGDPVRHPQFNEILELPRNFDIGFVNTGNFQKNFKWELLREVKWVRFSIDSLRNDIYKKIRARDNLYTEVLPNIKKAQGYLKEVGINFTVQNINAAEVYDIIKYCAKEEIYRLVVYPMHGDNALCMTKEQERCMLQDLLDAKAAGYWDLIPENNFQFLVDNLMASDKVIEETLRTAAFDLEKHPCMINKIHLSIGPDGEVFPCAMIADDTDAYKERDFYVKYIHNYDNEYLEIQGKTMHTLGNVIDETLMDIWERHFTSSFRSEEKCKLCWSRYQPLINAYHEGKEALKERRMFV